MSQVSSAPDENFIMAKYLSGNRGNHRVIGPVTKINYGYRSGGQTFLVHKDDLQPHLFMEVDTVAPPTPPLPPTPEPEVIEIPAMPAPELLEPGLEPELETIPVPPPDVGRVAEDVITDLGIPRKVDLQALPGITKEIAEQLEQDEVETIAHFLGLGVEGLQKYRGIGKVKAEAIYEAVESIAAMAAKEAETT